MNEPYLTVREVGSLVRRSPRRVRDWIRSGELAGVDISAGAARARYIVAASALETFIQARSSSRPPEIPPSAPEPEDASETP